MGRDTTKHGARLDDALKAETRPIEQGAPVEPRTEEWREHEPAGDEDPAVSARPNVAAALGDDPVQARRELSRHLRLGAFPAERDALLEEAVSQHAPPAVVETLRKLPAGTEYATVHEVWAAVSGFDDPAEAARHEPLSAS
jgi:hypothetical protein